MDSSYGLGWKDELMGAQPIWTAGPSIKLVAEIAHRHLKLNPDEISQTATEFRFEDAFDKLYAAECPRVSFFMRVSLPVDPRFKISSEVATIALLQWHTSVLATRVIASNATSDNKLQFEWILMERVHGLPLADIWASLTWDVKVSCVKEVADTMAQLFELRHDSIGNLFNAKDLLTESERKYQNKATRSSIMVLDRIGSMVFFWNTHLKSNISRGPFASSKDWLDARFQLMQEDCRRFWNPKMPTRTTLKTRKQHSNCLRDSESNFPFFFFSNADDREEFALHHNDIFRHNLIVDSKGKLQALVDWECVSVMPLKGVKFPLSSIRLNG